jgi:Rieske 2Fe-2S family protein
VRILDITNRQDFDACRRCQLGMASDAYRGFLVPAEHVVLGFHRWLRDRMGDGGPPA